MLHVMSSEERDNTVSMKEWDVIKKEIIRKQERYLNFLMIIEEIQ